MEIKAKKQDKSKFLENPLAEFPIFFPHISLWRQKGDQKTRKKKLQSQASFFVQMKFKEKKGTSTDIKLIRVHQSQYPDIPSCIGTACRDPTTRPPWFRLKNMTDDKMMIRGRRRLNSAKAREVGGGICAGEANGTRTGGAATSFLITGRTSENDPSSQGASQPLNGAYSSRRTGAINTHARETISYSRNPKNGRGQPGRSSSTHLHYI
ncbi:hypothetical protein MLD38_027521 [Melastoma candidum]|uniref:Uncharacterized protein n=1 Tax=Melastoma candidum TaxID=119954 RepID=A0ACB9P3C6_9MYRT|nr:hypothetical protein MLD38_027521 [Melastoma candidum]